MYLNAINLSCNLLTEFPYDCLKHLTNLVNLDLSRNQISSITCDM